MVFTTKHPFFLLVKPNAGPEALVDLEEEGWKETHADALAKPGRWYLCSTLATMKMEAAAIVLAVEVQEGEYGFYAARHIGTLTNVSAEIVCYGIGVKRDGQELRSLWRMPNGMVVSGHDVRSLGVAVRDKTL